MYLEDESHSYHISSLMDRKMKGEKLDGNLEKGFDMLRKDNQPQRARSSSLSSKRSKMTAFIFSLLQQLLSDYHKEADDGKKT